MSDSCWSAPGIPLLVTSGKTIRRRHQGQSQSESLCGLGLWLGAAGRSSCTLLLALAAGAYPGLQLSFFYGGLSLRPRSRADTKSPWLASGGPERVAPLRWRRVWLAWQALAWWMRLVTGEQAELRFGASCTGAWVGSIV